MKIEAAEHDSHTAYCKNHAHKETTLRCNRCNEPICAQCAVQTPTGYRCEQCIREQGKKFNTAEVQDYVLAFVVAVVISYIGSLISRRIGFFILFIAPGVGVLIAEAVRRVVNRRRSKTLFQTVAAAVVVGGLPGLLPGLFGLLFGAGLGSLLSLLWPGLYIFLAASSAYARISGIQLRR